MISTADTSHRSSLRHGDNLDGFRHRFSSTICEVECDALNGTQDFATCFDSVHLGTVDVFRYHGQSLRNASRKLHHIRANPVDDFLLLLPVSAPFELAQAGRDNVIEPGNFVVLATQKPFEGYCDRPADQLYTELKIRVPGAVLRQKIPHLDQCCAVPVAADDGIGVVMRSIVEQVLAERDAISEAKSRMYAAMLVNAIGIAALDAPELLPFAVSTRELAHARVRMRAREFIECHLSNPRLDCAMIAEHCRVSLRYLHAAFEAEATTTWTVIREARLQRCQEELLNPALRHQSILQIAMKWGYRSSASFARAYSERYVRSPSSERQTIRGSRH